MIYILIVLAIVILLILVLRLFLFRQAKILSDEIGSICDIPTELEKRFRDRNITIREKDSFRCLYADYFHHASRLSQWLKAFFLACPENVQRLMTDFESLESLVASHNEAIENQRLGENKDFFDTCLKYPLDLQQRKAILADEDNVLVVSSAGSGKTSSIVGKVKYLTEKLHVDPRKILLISYTNKAASELTDRIGTVGLKGYTFHKLALDIIGQVTGTKPSICDHTDALFVSIYKDLIKNKRFKKHILSYFLDYDYDMEDWASEKCERQKALTEEKTIKQKALFPDMDGNPVYVRSEQEKKICFALTALGVQFRYEEPYEHVLADETHSQYKPDFSIYYEKDGEKHRIYLEHFGVDEHGMVPAWFAKDKGISYDEANQRYGDSITWKKAAHEKFGTMMISTSSMDFYTADIVDKLETLLNSVGVPTHRMTEDELYQMVISEGSKEEKTFIRLAVTFITLLKTRCETIDQTIKNAKQEDDERSLFAIKKIFKPIYDEYAKRLKNQGQIDFTDAILQATQLCNASHSVDYDYIIVDEYQDISADRYHFLQALRMRPNGNLAKIFCVGDDWQSIYRFSGSDMTLFSKFEDFFGPTDVRKIETTYRFGEPLVGYSSQFIQRNSAQLRKNVHPFNPDLRTELLFQAYDRSNYVDTFEQLIQSIPSDKSIFLLGRYSFDDYYLSFQYKGVKEGNNFYYIIGGRKIEFLTVHKSKGLEADVVIILQCNKGTFGFPSQISDDPVLHYVLSGDDNYPYGEERRLFYVAITRAKEKTFVMYDRRYPSVFVDEFLHPERITGDSYKQHRNANKRWSRAADDFLLQLHGEGKSIRYISNKMGRSQTSIIMRLSKLGVD